MSADPGSAGGQAGKASGYSVDARQAAGSGLLVVSGVSGAGKSSLVRAGVLPQIRGARLAGAPGSARWPCLVFTPRRRAASSRADPAR